MLNQLSQTTHPGFCFVFTPSTRLWDTGTGGQDEVLQIGLKITFLAHTMKFEAIHLGNTEHSWEKNDFYVIAVQEQVISDFGVGGGGGSQSL